MASISFTELPKLHPSPLAVEVAASILSRRSEYYGSIGHPQAELLLTVIEMCDARKVVEIGVASGASSLYMLAMLHALQGARQLFAFDTERFFYGDRSKLSGYLALESEFNRDNRFVLRGDASSLSMRPTIADYSLCKAAPVDVAFVDGNHRHPWPTIDFLFLIPLMREGGMVVFHDINLRHLTNGEGGAGPMRLFSCPFASRYVEPGDSPNIGVVRMGDKSDMIDLAMASLAKAWDVKLGRQMHKRVMAEVLSGPLSGQAEDIGRFFSQ